VCQPVTTAARPGATGPSSTSAPAATAASTPAAIAAAAEEEGQGAGRPAGADASTGKNTDDDDDASAVVVVVVPIVVVAVLCAVGAALVAWRCARSRDGGVTVKARMSMFTEQIPMADQMTNPSFGLEPTLSALPEQDGGNHYHEHEHGMTSFSTDTGDGDADDQEDTYCDVPADAADADASEDTDDDEDSAAETPYMDIPQPDPDPEQHAKGRESAASPVPLTALKQKLARRKEAVGIKTSPAGGAEQVLSPVKQRLRARQLARDQASDQASAEPADQFTDQQLALGFDDTADAVLAAACADAVAVNPKHAALAAKALGAPLAAREALAEHEHEHEHEHDVPGLASFGVGAAPAVAGGVGAQLSDAEEDLGLPLPKHVDSTPMLAGDTFKYNPFQGSGLAGAGGLDESSDL